MIFTKWRNIPFNPIRGNVFLPKKLIKLNEGIIRDNKMMHIEPATAVKGNRRKLPYPPAANICTGNILNGPLFRLNMANTHVAVSRIKKTFRYGFIFL